MWLLLREGADVAALIRELESAGWIVRLGSAGSRPLIWVESNGHAPTDLATLPQVEAVFTESTQAPLVRLAKPEYAMGTWRRGQEPLVIAGPCSVESRDQLLSVAAELKALGVHVLRGGAFKARTSPYAFQGLGSTALELLLEAKALTGLPICVEILAETHLPLYEGVDVLQIGARNMDNYELLKVVAQSGKPILLKRNPQARLTEFLLAAEYLLVYGASAVILCERGIRTFSDQLRYTLDVGGIAVLRQETRLAVIADPSHAAGDAHWVEPLALAAVAAGAEGLIVEVHPEPAQALSDAAQQLTPWAFSTLLEKARKLYATLAEPASLAPALKAAS